MPNWATTGLVLASSRMASNSASPPVVVPPGLLMNRITPATCLFSPMLLQELELVAILGDQALEADAGDLAPLREADRPT